MSDDVGVNLDFQALGDVDDVQTGTIAGAVVGRKFPIGNVFRGNCVGSEIFHPLSDLKHDGSRNWFRHRHLLTCSFLQTKSVHFEHNGVRHLDRFKVRHKNLTGGGQKLHFIGHFVKFQRTNLLNFQELIAYAHFEVSSSTESKVHELSK